jgi:hypothetical protein
MSREEVAILHNEELHNLYSSPNMAWAGHVAHMGEMRNAYNFGWKS